MAAILFGTGARLWLLVLFLSLEMALAQAPSPGGFSELDAVRGPFERNTATLQAASDAAVEKITASYLAALDRLEKDFVARGNTTGPAEVQSERQRIANKLDLKEESRKMMPPALSALRARYDADRQAAEAPFQREVQQQKRQYVSALDTLQRRLLAANEVAKAALVLEARTAVAGKPAGSTGVEKTAKPIAESTVRKEGKLDAALAERIEAAVKAKSVVKTESSDGKGTKEGGSDIPPEGALLVGFEYMEVGTTERSIRSIRPYFMNREAIVAGKDRGKMESVTDKVMARPGYAVAGILIDGKKGMQVIFMKIDPAGGRFDTASSSVYKSKWYGSRPRAKPMQIGGDGKLVVGLYGNTGADSDTLGLVQMP